MIAVDYCCCSDSNGGKIHIFLLALGNANKTIAWKINEKKRRVNVYKCRLNLGNLYNFSSACEIDFGLLTKTFLKKIVRSRLKLFFSLLVQKEDANLKPFGCSIKRQHAGELQVSDILNNFLLFE